MDIILDNFLLLVVKNRILYDIMKKANTYLFALKRFSLISPVINRQVDNNMQYYIRVTKEPIEMPYYGMRRYSPKTLESWYCDYLKKGIDGLKPSSRGDKGKYRVIPEQLSEKIIDMRIKYPKAPGSVIYEMLLKDRVFEHNDISMSSFYRFLRTIPQQIKEKDAEVAELKRFSHQYINELWQTDLAYGPYIYNGNKRKATYLLAIIDDAARFVPHAQFYFSQGFESLRHLFKEAVMKKGVPTLLYTDNGRIYRSQQFEYICASIGCTLIHAKPFAANSKGKIERFFLSVRQRFLSRIETDKIKDIDAATASFGQGIAVTPLQMVMSYQAIANKGVMMKPHIVKKIIYPNGQEEEVSAKIMNRVVSEKTAATVSAMLVNVVEKGHSKKAAIAGYYVGGKTGTAQIAAAGGYKKNEYVHTFVGIAPIEEPAFVMLTKIDKPVGVQYAEGSALPLWRDIAEFILNYYAVPKTRK